jgi:hypothetical protein
MNEFGFSSALTLSKHLNMQIFDKNVMVKYRGI